MHQYIIFIILIIFTFSFHALHYSVAINNQEFYFIQIIHLNFSEFSLEGPLPLCAYDRVIIYDGDLVLAQLCGDVTNGGPAVYQSTTNIVRIQFISDISEQRSGFVLHYEMIGTASGKSEN